MHQTAWNDQPREQENRCTMCFDFWKQQPIRRQLILAVNGLLLIVIVLFLFVGHRLRIRDAREEKRTALIEEAKTIYESVDAMADQGRQPVQQLIDDVCARMSSVDSPGHHIALEWQGHSMQAQSHGQASHQLFQHMIRQAKDENSRTSTASSSLVVARFEGPRGVIYVSETEESVLRNARQELIRQIVAVLVSGSLAGLIVNFVLMRVVTNPLQRLVTTIGRIGDGDLAAEAKEHSCEELNYLSSQVNAMSQKLAAADRDRRLHMKKARKIQQNLCPEGGHLEGVRTAELFEPADDVGGDYYDVLALGDHKSLLCLADVSGHGVPAAMTATVIKALVLEAVEVTHSPAEILNRINRRYPEIIMDGHFATMVVVLVDSRRRVLTSANAGHVHPFIHEPGESVQQLEASDLLIGVDTNTTYSEQTTSVASGTRVVLVSDGVTEMFDPNENQFGVNRLRQVMEASPATDVRQLVDDLSAALTRFRQSRRPLDDLTLLAAELT